MTTITLLVEGSLDVEVKLLNADGTDSTHTTPKVVPPNSFVTLNFMDGETVSLREITS